MNRSIETTGSKSVGRVIRRPTAALVDQLAERGIEPAIEEQELHPLFGIQCAQALPSGPTKRAGIEVRF